MTVYCERANGRWEYWTYCDHRRVYLSQRVALREVARGARYVELA